MVKGGRARYTSSEKKIVKLLFYKFPLNVFKWVMLTLLSNATLRFTIWKFSYDNNAYKSFYFFSVFTLRETNGKYDTCEKARQAWDILSF